MSLSKFIYSLLFSVLLGLTATANAAEVCTAIGASHYYKVTHPDLRMCPSPMCGGYFVKEVNKLKTLCADGVWRPECHVANLDAKAMGWTQEQADDYFNTVFGTKTGIVRGNFAHALDANNPLGSNTPDILSITEAWQAQTKKISIDPVYHVKDQGIVCIAYPCVKDTIEQLLNFWDVKDKLISDVVFNKTGASQTQIDAAYKAFSEGGLLVAGRHQLTTDKLGNLLIASQFYLPFTPTVLPPPPVGQACGGKVGASCSVGQVCNITTPNACGSALAEGTCIVKPEVCTMQYQPVCGCDNVTYSNDCARAAAGAQLNYVGACR